MLTLLIAAALLGSDDTAARYPDAVEVYHCDFGKQVDKNFDGWPDAWTRESGPGYPPYLQLGIVSDQTALSKRAFAIRLDGGAGAAQGPLLPIQSQFSYVFEARVRTEGHPKPSDPLRRDEATISLTFYDSQERVLAVHHSHGVTHAAAWQLVRIGPIAPPADTASARLGLRLGPKQQGDLRGSALFDDLWLGRLPRMSLKASEPHHVYHDAANVKVTCEISGIAERDPMLVFRLFDVSRPEAADKSEEHGPANDNAPALPPLAEHRVPVTGLTPLPQAAPRDGRPAEAGSRDLVAGSVSWQPPLAQPGLYRVEAELVGKQGVLHRKTLQICLVSKLDPPAKGEFGWSLPDGEKPLALGALTELLAQSGLSWAKFPVWYSEREGQARADQVARFVDQLSSRGIELVGLLDQPPADLRSQFGSGQERLPAAVIFADSDLWHPVLAPVMTRLSLKVRWWQLGRDDDTSFLGDSALEKKLQAARKQLERFGQESKLGIAWPWTQELPPVKKPAWDFVSHTERPALTADELESYLGSHPSTSDAWVSLRPLPRSQYDAASRMRDLVGRMIAARIAGAGKIFIPQPFDSEEGLCTEDGQPDELFLPWRTTAHFLAGAKYLGSLDLPGGSSNHLFARGDEGILIVWGPGEGSERIYLGQNLKQQDLWGRTLRARAGAEADEIAVSTLPTFVTGVNLPIARWHMSCHLTQSELASVFGRAQPIPVRFKNTFGQGVRIDVTFEGADTWDVRPKRQTMNLAAGEEGDAIFDIQLRSDASTGPQTARIDFQVAAEQNYKFSIYRPLVVGLGDVQLELTSHLDAQGNLVVEQRLINTTDKPVNFNCYLFIPDRRRMRRQVFELAQGRDVKLYMLAGGKDLIGKSLWVRAEEVDGERVLNQRIIGEE